MTVRSHFTGLLCLASDIIRYPDDARSKSDLALCERSLEYLNELMPQEGANTKCFEGLREIYTELLGDARAAIQQHEAGYSISLPEDVLFA